jgi:hypothetical protein
MVENESSAEKANTRGAYVFCGIAEIGFIRVMVSIFWFSGLRNPPNTQSGVSTSCDDERLLWPGQESILVFYMLWFYEG